MTHKTVKEYKAECALQQTSMGKTPDKADFATVKDYVAACNAQRSEDARRRHAPRHHAKSEDKT